MKISRTVSPNPAEVALTAQDMLKKPGVYKCLGSNSRFVVCSRPGNSHQAVLYVDSSGNVENFDINGWRNSEFVEVKEIFTLTFNNKD